MAAKNFFEAYGAYAFSSHHGPCVFISHSKTDKDYAKIIANALLAMSVDIYFDENDKMLQQAASLDQDAAIVKCIEDGLDHSTHLLGLITRNTKGSWWVPYEIGGATGRKKECAHLVAPDVTEVPSFIKIRKLLLDQWDLSSWASSLVGKNKEELDTHLKSYASASSLSTALPGIRSMDKLKFY